MTADNTNRRPSRPRNDSSSEMDSLKNSQNQLKGELGDVKKSLNNVEDTLDKILHAIIGSELNNGEGGLIRKVGNLEGQFIALKERVDKLEKQRDSMKYFLIGLGVFGAVGASEVIQKIIALIA